MVKKGMQIGLLIFGMTFGAGNLIFPPSLGFQAGPAFVPAIIGFIISGVGMPVVSLIMGTFNPGGFRAEMNRKISPLFSLVILTLIYLAIGPLMAIPRTAATSFSVGILPIAGDGTWQLAVYTLLYFALAWWLSITPSKLLSRIGKVLTPIFAIMIVILFVVGLMVYTSPELAMPAGKYASAAFGSGFIEGYNTVDTIAAFAFCIIALQTMQQMGFASKREYYISVWAAGASVAVLMGGLYLGLGLLGNHFPIPPEVYQNPSINLGAYVLTQASYTLLGSVGVWFLAVMVALACFTTSVGLIAAVSEFFAAEFPRISYKGYVTIITVFSFAVANMGLNQIITVSLPLLLFVYPIAITVVMLIIVNKFVRLSRPGMRLCVAVAGICAVIDILHQFAGVALAGTIMEGLPLGTSGLGWMVPVCICLLLSLVLPQKITGQVDVVEETK
ncbi:branched-chain amino acid transport system II carrier protein [Megasphaera hominis]|jgi:LIVCS family branched-chain amino acid:cation transporter|uniref:Branched-chain amino acid transport system carrier protein n=1 Tax=Megasphaera hominis TaxID=159836 RepID=A0ABR6VI75_9FIRM|nr:branched-chain amino acid transport system II carrier protein [Megasphaera hominis]MBC3536945.1 branched-chain amino acid transport system II carrier protein [Megasphaera hominis]